MIEERPAASLGATTHNGVNSLHHFCFGPYQSISRMNWGRLRTLNRIWLEPRGARDPNFLGGMEVLVLVEKGTVHVQCGEDQLKLAAGDIALLAMNAGADYGIANRAEKPAELIELWLTADRLKGPPNISRSRLGNTHAVLASQDVRDHPAMVLQSPAKVLLLDTGDGNPLSYKVRTLGHAYVYVLEGEARVGDQSLHRNDAIAVCEEHSIILDADPLTRCLVVDCHDPSV